MKLFIAAVAEEELLDISRYYASVGGVELGKSFVDEFQRAVELLLLTPELGKKLKRSHRHYPLRRFPYRIIYQVRDDALRVIAIAHHRRRPGYWSKR